MSRERIINRGARGGDGRTYPWGNEYQAKNLNMNVGEADEIPGGTTAVGIYEAGKSPFGLYDCAGNVREWCATRAPNFELKPYPYDVTEDEWAADYMEGTDVRVLRGGSWDYDYEGVARCAFRDHGSVAYIRSLGLGFRIVSPIF